MVTSKRFICKFGLFALLIEQLGPMVATKCKEKINFYTRLRKNCDDLILYKNFKKTSWFV